MITYKAKTASGELINSSLSGFTFPAGEKHIKAEERRELEPTEIAVIQFTNDSIHNDLFELGMWANYLHNTNAANEFQIRLEVVMPYFPGARADRGKPFGVSVYADFVASMRLDHLTILDPHSKVVISELLVSCGLTNANFMLNVVTPDEILRTAFPQKGYVGIIAPDAGAVSRAQGVADVLDLPLYTATKTRDFETGKLSFVAADDMPTDGKLLIVDDICDGGGTFMALAGNIGVKKENLDLYVSHGVFSGDAIVNLPRYFANIYTSNSFNVSRVLMSPFHRINVLHYMLSV